MPKLTNRRVFLGTTTAAAAALMCHSSWTERTTAQQTRSPNERPRFGCIGNGGMGTGDGAAARQFGDIVANCDVDKNHAGRFQKEIAGGKSDIHEDYRALLDRKDVDLVTISTPDHWHSRICIAALKAGKDVYCQKPLTLTIAEGKLLAKTVKDTGRVLQVGTQQRSDTSKFLTAVAMCQQGRIGRLQRATVAIGGAPKGGPFKKGQPPAGLNWDLWLGQAPLVEYIAERCHGNFRWWYEYSGGKMTDWGAHHVDIAQWALGFHETGPLSLEPVSATHPVEYKDGNPLADDAYNAATKFNVKCTFAGEVELIIREDAQDLGFDNGILFEGDAGRFFVNRGKITGEPVDALKQKPIGDDVLAGLRKGKKHDSHMGNFVASCKDRSLPISDVYSHHRALTTCHLANIAIRLNRTLKWDAAAEQITGDDAANKWQAREQRKGYEVEG